MADAALDLEHQREHKQGKQMIWRPDTIMIVLFRSSAKELLLYILTAAKLLSEHWYHSENI